MLLLANLRIFAWTDPHLNYTSSLPCINSFLFIFIATNTVRMSDSSKHCKSNNGGKQKIKWEDNERMRARMFRSTYRAKNIHKVNSHSIYMWQCSSCIHQFVLFFSSLCGFARKFPLFVWTRAQIQTHTIPISNDIGGSSYMAFLILDWRFALFFLYFFHFASHLFILFHILYSSRECHSEEK